MEGETPYIPQSPHCFFEDKPHRMQTKNVWGIWLHQEVKEEVKEGYISESSEIAEVRKRAAAGALRS